MKKIYYLIQSLTSSEWQALENYLTCFASNKEPKKKSFRLAQLLRESEHTLSVKIYSKKLYGKENIPALERLARNLRNKILNSLTADLHCENENESDIGSVSIKLRRKSLQFNYLFTNKRDLEITENLLDEIITGAKEHELYFMGLEHLKRKKWEYALRKSKKEFDALSEEMRHYKKMDEAYEATYDYYCELIMLYEFSGKPDEQKIISFLEKAIPDVKEKYAVTNSKIILYYLKLLEMDEQLLKKNYLSARSIGYEIINIVKTNKSVFTKRRVGTAYDNLSTCLIHLGRFEEAVESTRYALQFIEEGSFNYALSKQWEFYALFYNKQYPEAETCAREMLKAVNQKGLGDFRYEKFYFLLANALFVQKKFEEASDLLCSKFEIKEDKEGWEFSWRVLQIMTNIELGYCDNAGKEVKSLRSFVDYNENTNFSPRHKIILQYLLLAEYNSFVFSQLNGKANNYMELLLSPEKECAWEIFSSELIPFHEWAMSKVKVKKQHREMVVLQ